MKIKHLSLRMIISCHEQNMKCLDRANIQVWRNMFFSKMVVENNYNKNIDRCMTTTICPSENVLNDNKI